MKSSAKDMADIDNFDYTLIGAKEGVSKTKAKQKYASLWRLAKEFYDAGKSEEGERIGLRMDHYQPFITEKPGPEWSEFTEALPGFNDFWNSFKEEALAQIKDALPLRKIEKGK